MRPGERVRIESEQSRASRGRPVRHDVAPGRDGFDVFAERVRWTPVFVGVLCAFTTMFLLASFGAAVGANTGLDSGRPFAASGLWPVISGLVAFLLGGYVAGKIAHAAVPGSGALHGALVFMLAVPLVLWLASQGARTSTSWFGGVPGTWTAFVGVVVAFVASSIGGSLASSRAEPRSR